jgi:GT2 family glycosyltransferase
VPELVDAPFVVLRLGAPTSEVLAKVGALPDDTFCLFLGDNDLPERHLLEAIRQVAQDPAAQIMTFDLIRATGGRTQLMALPGANPVLLAARDYIFSRAAVRASLLKTGRFDGPRALILRWCAERSIAEQRAGWRHVPTPVMWVGPNDLDMEAETAAALARMHRPVPRPSSGAASAILCTRDKGHLTRQLARQLLALDEDLLAELVIVSNGTANPYALQTLADLAGHPRVRIIQRDEPFNFSRLCNAGAREARPGGPLLFINDDVAPVSDGWLAALLNRLEEPGVGAVGPLLLYPREQVQHAGMYLRRLGGAGHTLRGARLPQDDYLCMASAEREVSCLTGAVLLTSRAAFESVGGFDEQFVVGLQDVDYGLKLHAAGLRNVFEPRSVLLHMESASIDPGSHDPRLLRQRHADWSLFMQRWGERPDPFHPAGFDPDDETLHRLAVQHPRPYVAKR